MDTWTPFSLSFSLSKVVLICSECGLFKRGTAWKKWDDKSQLKTLKGTKPIPGGLLSPFLAFVRQFHPLVIEYTAVYLYFKVLLWRGGYCMCIKYWDKHVDIKYIFYSQILNSISCIFFVNIIDQWSDKNTEPDWTQSAQSTRFTHILDPILSIIEYISIS